MTRAIYLVLLIITGTAVSRVPSETCQSLKNRLMKTFQERANKRFMSVRSASQFRTLSCEEMSQNDHFSEVQFQDCLLHILGESGEHELTGSSGRSECISEFWKEADRDADSKVSGAEFLSWKKIGVLDLLLTASELENEIAENETSKTTDRIVKKEETQNAAVSGVKVQIGDVEFELTSRQAESLSDVITALQSGNPLEAFVQLYRLLAASVINGFNTNILIPLSEVMQAMVERTLPRIGSQAMSILAGVIFGGEQAIIAASEQTISAVTGLIRATVDNNGPDISTQIYNTITGLITDLTPIRRGTIEQVVSLLRSLAERGSNSSITSDDTLDALTALMSDVGVSGTTQEAVLNLAQAIIEESPNDILNEISHIFDDVLGSVSALGAQAAGSLNAIVRAIAEGDRQEAVMQTSHLHRLVSRQTGACQTEYLVTSLNTTHH